MNKLLTLTALLAASLPTLATARPLVVRATLQLKQRIAAPSFSPVTQVRLLDRGRRLLIGTGITREHETIYMLRLGDLGRETVRVPLAAYVRANPGIKLDRADRTPAHEQFWIRRLLFYDLRTGEAGVEVTDRYGSDQVRRHFFIHWNLKRGKLGPATLVARGRPGRSHAEPLALGYEHGRKEFYYARQIYKKGDYNRTVHVIGFAAGRPRVVTRFRSARAIQRTTYFDPAHRRALLVEYAELATPTPPPKGHLVQLASGKVTTFAVPMTCYGVAFGHRGKRIYLYSNQLGQLWVVDAATGKRLHKLAVRKQGHALGLVRPGQLLLLRNNGLRFFSAGKRLRRKGSIPIKRIYQGFSNVGGSMVLPGGALIRNGDALHVLAFPRRGK